MPSEAKRRATSCCTSAFHAHPLTALLLHTLSFRHFCPLSPAVGTNPFRSGGISEYSSKPPRPMLPVFILLCLLLSARIYFAQAGTLLNPCATPCYAADLHCVAINCCMRVTSSGSSSCSRRRKLDLPSGRSRQLRTYSRSEPSAVPRVSQLI